MIQSAEREPRFQGGSLMRRLVVEAIGTAIVLATVVGSRVIGDRLSGGVVGITFLVNSAATASIVIALLVAFAPISGAHLNPAVSFAAMLRGRMSVKEALSYGAAQLTGAFVGVGATLLMLGRPVFSWSNPPRATVTEITGEFLAVFGLICVMAGGARLRAGTNAFAVGGYLAAIYWFTESTSFANPAVTIAKGLTATSSSIHPADVSLILSAQLLGAAACALLFRWILPPVGAPRRRHALIVFASTDRGALAQTALEALESFGDPSQVRATAAAPFLASDGPVSSRVVPLSEELLDDADLVVTVGPTDEWAAITSADRIHWTFPPLTGADDTKDRALREELRVRVKLLLRELGLERMRSVGKSPLSLSR